MLASCRFLKTLRDDTSGKVPMPLLIQVANIPNDVLADVKGMAMSIMLPLHKVNVNDAADVGANVDCNANAIVNTSSKAQMSLLILVAKWMSIAMSTLVFCCAADSILFTSG